MEPFDGVTQDAQPMPADIPAPRTVRVVSPDGVVGTVPEAELATAISSGFEVYNELEAKYGDQNIRAALEGVARGAYLGASDYVQAKGAAIGTQLGNYAADLMGVGETGIDRTAEAEAAERQAKADILGRKEANPYLSTGGEILGAIGTTVATGGFGGAAVAGRVVQGATLGAKAARLGIQGAIEGAAYGAAQAADQDFLADKAITAERIMMGAGTGALLGGVLAGSVPLLGAAGTATLRGVKGAKARLFGGKAAGAVDDVAGAAQSTGAGSAVSMEAESGIKTVQDLQLDGTLDQTLRQASTLSNSVESQAEAALDMTFEPVYEKMGALVSSEANMAERSLAARTLARARAASGGFDKAQQTAVKRTGDALDEFMRIKTDVQEQAGIVAKRRAAKKLNGFGRPVSSPETVSVLDSYESVLLDLKKQGARINEGGGSSAVRDLLANLKQARSDFGDALARGDVGDAAMVIDDFKRSADRVAANTRNMKVMTTLQGETGTGGANDLLRRHLENEAIFGEFAETQKLVNPIWSEDIKRSRDQLLNGFLYESGEKGAGWRPLKQANRKTIGGLLDTVGGPRSEEIRPTEIAFRKWLRASELDAATRAKAWGAPELAERAAKMKELREIVEAEFNGVAASRIDKEAWMELVRDTDLPGPVGYVLKGTASLVNKAAGLAESASDVASAVRAGARAVSGTATEATTKVGMSAAADAQATAIYRARQAAAKGEQVLDDAADAVVREAKPSSGVTRADKVTSAIPIAGVVFSARNTNSYEQTVNKLVAMQDPNSDERQEVRSRFADLGAESPEHAQALDAQVQRNVDYLVSKAGPTGPDVTRAFSHLDKRKPDQAQVQAFARALRAVQDPQGALMRIARGTHTREDLEALKATQPALWERFQNKVMAQLGQVKRKPSYAARVRLAEVLDRPLTVFDEPTYQQVVTEAQGAAAREEARAKAPSTTQLARGSTNMAIGSDGAIARGQ